MFWRDYIKTPAEDPHLLWQRLNAAGSNQYGIIANFNGEPAGFAHYVTQPTTKISQPLCYLEDLYTAPEFRGRQIARTIIGWLHQQADEQSWRGVYWITRSTNEKAQILYDKIAYRTNWLRYELNLSKPFPI